MREIKLRAWLLHDKIMADVICLCGHTVTVLHNENEITTPGCEIMQFTGLYDKNGKEIYESDLIRLTAIELEESHIFPIVWDKYAGWTINDPHTTLGYYAYRDTDYALEVIGNIYENPELLTPREEER